MAAGDGSEFNRTNNSDRPWRIGFLLALLVAAVCFVLAVQQLLVKYFYDQSAHPRTIGGVLYLAVGLLGPVVPVLVWRNRRTFSILSSTRQWIVAVGIPLAIGLIFGLGIFASRRSTTLVLPRPFTPTLVVRYDPAEPKKPTVLRFDGGLRRDGPYQGRSDLGFEGGFHRASVELRQSFLLYPDEITVTATSQTELSPNAVVQIVLDINATEKIRIAVEGLKDGQIRRDNIPLSAVDAFYGQSRVIVTGTATTEN
jgi:hypothetical protein